MNLFAITLRSFHTGLQMNQVVEKVMLEVGGETWKRKRIGIATDEACNMTSRHRGAVKMISEGTFTGFYQVCCAAHQLDLVVQDVVSGLCKDTFYATLTALIGHLLRQQKLVANMKSTCPTVASTRWISLGRVTI